MINQQTMCSRWHEVAAKLRERWPILTADDIHAFDGNVDDLVDKIAGLTGEPAEAIREVIEEALGIVASVRARAAQITAKAVAGAREGFENVRDQSERSVRQHPVETTLLAFGAGLLAGLGGALLLRSRPQPTRMGRVRGFSNELAHRIAMRVAELDPGELKRFLHGGR